MATNFIGTLLENSPSYNVAQGFSTRLYDAAGSQTISVSAGASLSLVGSIGSNVIQLAGNADTWQVMRDGSTAILINTLGDRVEVPAILQTQTVQFADKTASLRIDVSSGAPAVKLGTQTLTGTAQAVAAWGEGSSSGNDGGNSIKTPWTLVMVNMAVEGNRLFLSDGTTQGTGSAQNSLMNHHSVDGGLAVTEDHSKAYLVQAGDVLVSDGTADGTAKLTSASGLSWKAVVGNQLVASALQYTTSQTIPRLLISDGTSQGTKWFEGVPVPQSVTPLIDTASKKIMFTSQTIPYGNELAVIDLTSATAHLVKDINPGQANSFDTMLSGGFLPSGKFLFVANKGTGNDLWITDGTVAGTTEVANLANQYFLATTRFAAMGEKWVFAAFVSGGDYGDLGYKLVVSDGTQSGTAPLNGNYSPNQLIGSANGKLYFTGTSFGANIPLTQALFSTDGATLTKVADISADAALLAQSGNKLFFRSSDAGHGSELWVSDTVTGTFSLVKDILPGTGSSLTWSNDSFLVGGKLVFTAYTDAFKKSLFVSDGTEVGTVELSSSFVTHSATPKAVNRLVFADSNGVQGVNVNDLLPTTTRLVSETLSPAYLSQLMQSDDDQVFFQTGVGNLYSTDGSAAGTSKLAGNVVKFKVVAEDALFFIQQGSTGGLSLWYSNGLTTGTRYVEDLPSEPLGEAVGWRYDLEHAVAVKTVGVPEQT